MGILAVLSAPAIGKAMEKVDPRLLISVGFVGLGLINVWRMGFNSDVTFLQMALPTLLCGPFMVMFFLPLSGLVVASVDHDEQANAAGLSNFMRTIGGAFATSLVQTGWGDAARSGQTELAGAMAHSAPAIAQFEAGGVSHDSAVALLGSLVEGQSVMLATLQIFGVVAILFFGSAVLIWIAPRPQGPIDASAAH
jgi:DHA2 family multidrug resistance protein